MATMHGVVLLGNRRLEIREYSVPEPGHGQVLLRMRASGICGSDLHYIYRPVERDATGPAGYQGVIAGHEPCGIVEQVGPGVTRFRPGDRVVVYHIAGCGLCPACQGGWQISCSSPARAAYGWQRDGGHGDFLLAEERTLVALPDELTYLDGATIACGVGTAYAACLRASISGRDTVLVTGLGPVGLATSMLCQAMGAKVIGVDTLPDRRALAEHLHVAEKVVGAEGDRLSEALQDATQGRGFEVAIDCSGNAQARHLCLEMARDWGRVVYVGELGSVTFEPSPLLIHKQLALFGSWVCSVPQMVNLVEQLVRWRLHTDKMVTHRFNLNQAQEAYQLFDAGRTGKVAIVWE